MKKIYPTIMIALMISSALSPFFFAENSSSRVVTGKTILYSDDFEAETMKWLGVGSGSVTRSTEMAFSGEASMNITADVWNIEEALFQIGTPQYPLPFLVLDFMFSAPYSGIDYFCFGLEISSTHRDLAYCGGIIFPQGQYLNDSDVWTDIQGLAGIGWDLSDNYRLWHHATLKMDLTTGKYQEAAIDDYTVDLASLNYVCNEKPRYFWGIIYPWFYSGGSSAPCSILIDDVAVYMEG